jgi:DNA adenine methylase
MKVPLIEPFIRWAGGKTWLLPHLPKIIGNTTIEHYHEPFLGGGAMFFHLEPNNAIINDINARLINFYRYVQHNFVELSAELAELEDIYINNRLKFDKQKKIRPSERIPDDNEHLYYQLRDMYNGLTPSIYSDAALYYFINKTAYSGMIRFNAKGEYNVPYGRYKNFNTKILTEAHHNLLLNTEIHHGDYRNIFDMATPDDFIFLDPPYDCIFSDYGNMEYLEGFNEINHRELAQDFYNLDSRALLVIGDTPLIRELYGNNIIAEYNKNYSVNIRNRFQAGATHLIITNY